MSDSLVRVSRRVEWGARRPAPGARRCRSNAWEARAVRHNRDDGIPQAYRLPGALAAASIRAGPRPESSADRLIAVPHPTGTHRRPPFRFPPDNFKHSLTLFFKVLFIFPSRYLFAIGLSPVFSLGRNLPPDWGCIPKQPTRRQRLVVRQGPSTTGLSPSLAPLSRGLGLGPPLRTLLQTTIRTRSRTIFKLGFSRFARRY
ncbi:Uncharacterized protein Adt_48583 [Abeliophyllum distichum]|uniref:Uncharacterized protein n=1 Tax=Abeliophyllum distichum TaxID=126358 RepID=A0ABD1NRD9_9LAMI